MSSSFLQADGTLAPPRHHWWTNWLPTLSQVQRALQLDFSDPLTTPTSEVQSVPTNSLAISMRQGLGLVVVAALLAGFFPFLVNSFNAVRLGTTLPFLEVAEQAQRWQGAASSQLGVSIQTMAGLAPSFFPSWLAALLSTLGGWINWPLQWLTWWLVYGTATLLAAKVWSAPTTLQRFLGVASYASVPMILSGLEPIPCLGVVAQIAGLAWMLAVYSAGVRAVTGLNWGRTALAILLPAAAVALIGVTLATTFAATFLRFVF